MCAEVIRICVKKEQNTFAEIKEKEIKTVLENVLAWTMPKNPGAGNAIKLHQMSMIKL